MKFDIFITEFILFNHFHYIFRCLMMIGLIQNQHYIPILVQQILLKMLVNSLFHRQQIWKSSVSEFQCANETDTVVKVPTEASEIPPCAANETSETAVTCTNQNYQCSENIPNSNTTHVENIQPDKDYDSDDSAKDVTYKQSKKDINTSDSEAQTPCRTRG